MFLLRLGVAIFWSACIYKEAGPWTALFAFAAFVSFELIALDRRTDLAIKSKLNAK